MKKLFYTALIILFSSQLFAYDMDIPKRTFEIGMNVEAGVSNNYFAAEEMLVKDLEIDFTKISDEISSDGLVISTKEIFNTFLNLNLKNGWHFGARNGVEGSGNVSISKALFDFLGKGNSLNETLTFETDANFDLFYYCETNVEWKMFGFKFGFAPALFKPLVHVESNDSNVSFTNGPDGSITADVEMGLSVYSSGSIEKIDNPADWNQWLEWLKGGWGFDANFTCEHRLTETLQGRAYMRLPIVPGSMNNLAQTTFVSRYNAVDMIDMIKTGGEFNSEFKDFTYSTEKKYVSRPFRTGAEVNWRPFGEWMIFNGMLGFAVKYPWTTDAKAYGEFNFGVHGEIFKILGFDLSSSYFNEIFSQRAGIMLNFKVIEIDAGVAFQGASFSKSWLGSGAGCYVGVAVGW